MSMCARARQPPPPALPASRPSRQFQPVTSGVAVAASRSAVSTSTITFVARVKGMQSNERLFLVGGGEELGEWKAMHALELQSSDRRKWWIHLQLKPQQALEYKYIRISTENGESFVQWEEGPDSKNRHYYFSGASSMKVDDAEILHFRPKEPVELPLAKQTFYEESQEAAAGRSSGLNGNSVPVTVVTQSQAWLPFGGKTEEKFDVAKYEWANEMFERLNSDIKYLRDKIDNKLEQQFSTLKLSQDKAKEETNKLQRWLCNHENKIEDLVEKMQYANGTHKTSQEEHVKEVDNPVNLRQLLAEHLRDCTLAQKQRALEQDVASLQEKVQMNSTLLSGSDNRFLKLEREVASYKNEIDSHSKSLAGMQREISKLDLKIPEFDDRFPTCDSTAQKDFRLARGQLKELESQVASLREELLRGSQKTSEPPAAPAKTDLPSPVADPSHADRAKSPSRPAQALFSQNEVFHEWNEVGWKEADSVGAGSHVAPRRRSASMPKYTVPKGRSAFTGLSRPKKPEDEELRKVCLQVEQDLYEAKKRNDPVDLRKKLLKEVLLRLHPDKFDKTGQSSEAMIWFDSWRNAHVKWYYEPHDVPEADRKYLPKPSSGKDL